MERALLTIGLLLGSNIFMTWAWYGHLKKGGWAIPLAIAVSWLIALPEYILHVPANRIGHHTFGGPFSAAQLKIIQEAITLMVFTAFALLVLKEKLRPNDVAAMVLVMAAVCVSMVGRPSSAGSAGSGSASLEAAGTAEAPAAGAPAGPSGDADAVAAGGSAAE
jgi:uncharacterized protein (DUF486 family)